MQNSRQYERAVDSMDFFNKLCSGNQGIKDVLGMLLIIAIMAGAFMANLYAGMWGSANGWNLLASVLYVVFWTVFPKFFGKSRFLMKAGYIISICTLAASICCSVCVLMPFTNFIYKLVIIPAFIGLIFLGQFVGLTFFAHGFIGMYEIHYPVMILISALWVLYMRHYVRKQNAASE